MTQRKLTDEQKIEARNIARLLMTLPGSHSGVLRTAYDMLVLMDGYGTTDGNPWVEPQPEIGEGYRVATEADAQRFDREMHDVHGRWVPAHVGVYASNYTYRVPIDRIPTDAATQADG